MAAQSRAILLTDKKAEFNVVEKFYKMFPYDMSSPDYYALRVADVQRLADFSLQGLLEAVMINREYMWTEIDNFIIAAHGLYSESLKKTNGLIIPLFKGSQILMDARNLDYLLELANDPNAGDDKLATEEKEHWFRTRYGAQSYLPKGKLKELVTMMRDVRKFKVRRLTFRACDIGTNIAAMSTIGRCFGALFAEGPKVHMFYMPADVFNVVNEMTWQTVAKQAGMRGFIHGSNTAEEFAIKVTGKSVNRNKVLYATTPNLRWFIDSYIMPSSNYPTSVPKGSKPAPFFFCGMDITAPGGGSFALPLEKEYGQQIVWTDALPGNMI